MRKLLATLVLCCTVTSTWCTKPSILILANSGSIKGSEVHALAFHQKLIENGYESTIAVRKNSPLEVLATEANLPFYSLERKFSPELLIPLCKEKQIDIIQCNQERDVIIAKKIVQKYSARIVLTQHVLTRLSRTSSYDIDAIICVSNPALDLIKKRAAQHKFSTKLAIIPHSYFPEKFETFHTTQTKKEFFKKHFSFTPRDCPLLCSIANFYRVKNHELLLKAFAKLIHKEKRTVELVLAGQGHRRKKLESLAKKLKIDSYVHFLGFTNKVPEVLFHADINLLSSKKEGLGIALLEAALMKTPSVVPDKTGTIDVIKHNKTGLVFCNGQARDLVEKIKTLLDNPELAHTLAENAYNLVREEFDPQKSFEKHCEVYEDILKGQEPTKKTGEEYDEKIFCNTCVVLHIYRCMV